MAQADLVLKSGLLFHGVLSVNEHKTRVRFKLKMLPNGALTLRFRRLALTKETGWISAHWNTRTLAVPLYTLEARSDTGVEFRSERLTFQGLKLTHNERGAWLDLEGHCQTATLSRMSAAQEVMVHQRLQGFEGHGVLTADCELGALSLGGVTPLPDDGALSGFLRLRVPAGVDLESWAPRADALLRHVLQIMSFAGAQAIKAPIEERWKPGIWMLNYRAQSPSIRTGQNVVHPLDLAQIFRTAVESFFKPAIPVERLFFAIDWFTMSASHTEVRLVAAMSAIENLLDANLAKKDRQLFTDERFKDVSKAIRGVLATEWGEALTPEREAALKLKLLDVNRKSLEDKLKILLDRWRVPLDGISQDELKAAISARNTILHQGRYYKTPPTTGQRDLWDHVIVLRELLARIILTALGFKGRYNCFRGGYHQAVFPPPA